ncbi:MAG: putative Ig domain-containing protein, partial [bacterium]|nr:putative Ig domain-containing protein [bacterium]
VITTTIPAGATFSTSTGIFSWTPSTTGTSTATFTATDSHGSSTTHVVNLQVVSGGGGCTSNCGGGGGGGGNSPPTFVNFNPPTSICPASNYAYTVQAQDYDGDPITFSLVSAPAGMAIGPTSGAITWTPTSAQATTTPYTVTVKIMDGFSGPVSISYQLTVPTTGCGGGGPTPTSTPPVLGTSTQNLPPYFIGTSPALRACTGVLANYDVDAVDPDRDPLTFSLVAGPVGMTIAQRAGELFWVPTATQVGTTYPVTVAVTDGTYSVTRTIFATGVACGAPAPKPPSPPTVQGTSTVAIATSTCPTSTEAATSGTSLALLLASIGNWFTGSYCTLGLLLWILTLIAFIVYVYLNEREKKRMQGTIEQFAGNGLPLGMATKPGSIHDEVILDDMLVDDMPR